MFRTLSSCEKILFEGYLKSLFKTNMAYQPPREAETKSQDLVTV